MSKILVTGLAALALSASSAAGAGELTASPFASGAPTVRLHYNIADAHTPKGARHLATRIVQAAREVCQEDDPIARLSALYPGCRDRVIQRVLGQLNDPAVAQALGAKPEGLASAR